MITNQKPMDVEDRRTILSTLWIFATLNYLYCDVIGLMDSNLLRQYVTGNVNGMQLTQTFFLGAGLLMEIPIGMVILSRVLKYRVNRWANIITGIIMTVVQVLTLFAGSSTSYYIFFSIVEIAATTLIVWYAWTWTARAPATVYPSALRDGGEALPE